MFAKNTYVLAAYLSVVLERFLQQVALEVLLGLLL